MLQGLFIECREERVCSCPCLYIRRPVNFTVTGNATDDGDGGELGETAVPLVPGFGVLAQGWILMVIGGARKEVFGVLKN